MNAPKDSAAAFSVTVLTSKYFAQYANRNPWLIVEVPPLPVDAGSIGGMPGKMIAFIACLMGVTFPVTGVTLWINRLKKNRQKKKEKPRKKRTLVADVPLKSYRFVT